MRKTPYKVELRAEPAKPLEIELQGEAKFIALDASKGDAAKGPRRFTMTAYTGGPMRPKLDPPFPHPVVVDLAGMDLSKQRFPALKDHDSRQLVGHTERIITDGKALTAEGVVSGTGAAAVEVVAAHDNGFSWQVSMGATFGDMKLIRQGESVVVNGRSFPGPVFVARKGRLRELSFLTLGADDDTAATIAAGAAHKGEAMSFQDWLAANGFQPEDKLTEPQKTVLQASYQSAVEKEQTDADANADGKKKGKKKQHAKVAALHAAAAAENGDDDGDDAGNPATETATELRAEFDAIKRETAVYRLCGDKHTELAATAIKKNWDDETIKLAIDAADLRASLPNTIHLKARAKDAPDQNVVLEAALCNAGGLKMEKAFPDNVLEESNRQYRHGIGLQELLMEAAVANGYSGRALSAVKNDLRGVLMSACGASMQAANFSTVSLPGIFANTANKFLLEGYMAVEQVWKQIAATRSVSDFKTITSYRLTGNATFEEVPADGEIRHGTLGEQSFTNQAKTYAKMFAITRQDIINDDLGALSAIPRRLGRGSALKLNLVFWATWLADSVFFATAGTNNNYISGATTNLAAVGLSTGVTKMRKQTDVDGNPLAITPKFLLVPPELEVAANELYQSTFWNTGGSASTAQVAQKNIFAGRYIPIVSAYLTNATAWYLVADPADLPAIEVAFLNGQMQPTVESADTDFNTLGVQMRGYHDWGVALADPRAALKSKGAA